MDERSPADFYTGLVADLYAPLRSVAPDPAPYERFVRRWGSPALELGCGDGDPMLALRTIGIDVEGLDSSDDMLARCRLRAEESGIDVVLHHSPIESMELGRTYRSIYLAGPTFCLIVDDHTAARALERTAAHLDPDGRVLIPLFVPPVVDADRIGGASTTTEEDGTELRCTPISVSRDEDARLQTTILRYERLRPGGDTEVLELPWTLHWYTQDGFSALATSARLVVERIVGSDGGPARPDAKAFSFVLARA